MSSQSQIGSPLSLIKVASNTTKCLVFSQLNQSLHKFQLTIDDFTSVSNIIEEVFLLIKKIQKGQGIKSEVDSCKLYASKKNGTRASDLPSFSGHQKILKTGIKRFYLDVIGKTQKKKPTIGSVSTQSISSEMIPEKKQVKEMKASKQIGCFCFA